MKTVMYVRFRREAPSSSDDATVWSARSGPFYMVAFDGDELIGYASTSDEVAAGGGEVVIARHEEYSGWRRTTARHSEGLWTFFHVVMEQESR